MCTVNMTFEVPESKYIDIAALKHKVNEFVKQLIAMPTSEILLKEKEYSQYRVRTFNELAPEVQDLIRMTEPLKGTVPEWDLNGNITKTEVMREKYGTI